MDSIIFPDWPSLPPSPTNFSPKLIGGSTEAQRANEEMNSINSRCGNDEELNVDDYLDTQNQSDLFYFSAFNQDQSTHSENNPSYCTAQPVENFITTHADNNPAYCTAQPVQNFIAKYFKDCQTNVGNSQNTHFDKNTSSYSTPLPIENFPSDANTYEDSQVIVGNLQSNDSKNFLDYTIQPIENFAVDADKCNDSQGNIMNSQHLIMPNESGKRSSDESNSSVAPVPRRPSHTFGQRTSMYRGVTRHRWTGRYEAHLWDNSIKREGQRKGRQIYLGGYDNEEKAARAYDLAALKYWGITATTNFPIGLYEKEMEEMKRINRKEFLASIRRKSTGFARGTSGYRGVTRHHVHGRWQARIGRVAGNKDIYLGTFDNEEEAAAAYDVAAIKFRGTEAITNFSMDRYDVKSITGSSSQMQDGGEAPKRKKSSQAPEATKKTNQMKKAQGTSFYDGSSSSNPRGYHLLAPTYGQSQIFQPRENPRKSLYNVVNPPFNQNFIDTHQQFHQQTTSLLQANKGAMLHDGYLQNNHPAGLHHGLTMSMGDSGNGPSLLRGLLMETNGGSKGNSSNSPHLLHGLTMATNGGSGNGPDLFHGSIMETNGLSGNGLNHVLMNLGSSVIATNGGSNKGPDSLINGLATNGSSGDLTNKGSSSLGSSSFVMETSEGFGNGPDFVSRIDGQNQWGLPTRQNQWGLPTRFRG